MAALVCPVMIRRALKCLVAPWTRLARLTVVPSGPYLNLRMVPVLPTRAVAGVDADAEVEMLAERWAPSGRPARGAWSSMSSAARQASVGVVGLLDRGRPPHGHQLVADVVDQDALGSSRTESERTPITSLIHSTVLAGPSFSLIRLKPRMSQKRRVTSLSRPLSRSGLLLELLGEVGGEELLELNAGGNGGLFEPEPARARRRSRRPGVR